MWGVLDDSDEVKIASGSNDEIRLDERDGRSHIHTLSLIDPQLTLFLF